MRCTLSSDREVSRFFLPLMISIITTPKLYISAFSVICDVNHSGAKYPENMELWSLESSQIFRGSSMDPAQCLDTPNLDWLKVRFCREPRGGFVDHSFVTT